MNPIIRLVLKIATFAILLLTLASAFGGLIPPMIWAFPSVIVLALPYLLCLTVIVGLAWLIARRFITAACCAGVIFLSIPAAASAFPLRMSKTPSSSENTFTLLSYNILEGRDNENDEIDYSRSFSYMINSGADIICAQELYLMGGDYWAKVTKAQVDSLKAIYPFIIEGKNVAHTVFSKFPVVEGRKFPGLRRDLAVYHFKIKGHRVDIASVHLSTFLLKGKERNLMSEFSSAHIRSGMSELKKTVDGKMLDAFRARSEDAVLLRDIIDNSAPAMIVCGDFNDVPASWVYRHIKGDDMDDAVAGTCFGPMFTYNANYYFFRLDHILYRGDLRALSVKKESLKASDHYPLLATFEFIRKTK